MKVLRIPIPMDRLRSMTKEERAFLFLLGYAENQLVMIYKLIMFSTNKTPEREIEHQISAAQSHMLVRLAIGVVFEAWELVNNRLTKSLLGKQLRPNLGTTGEQALTELQKHFGSSNLLNKLRNNFSFHNPDDAYIEAGFERASRNKDVDQYWTWYVTPHGGLMNTFHMASDLVFMHGMLDVVGENDLVVAYEKIMVSLRTVYNALMELIPAVAGALMQRPFGSGLDAEVCLEINDAPNFTEVWIPFFVQDQ